MPWLGERATSQLFTHFELYIRSNDIEDFFSWGKIDSTTYLNGLLLLVFIGHYQSVDNTSAVYVHILWDVQNYT